MSKIEFPFELGSNYEDWELDLVILPDRVPNYDSYLYVGGEVKLFLNNVTYNLELVYNLDVLEAVIFQFKVNISEFKRFNNELTKVTSNPIVEVRSNWEFNHFNIDTIYMCSSNIKGVHYILYSRSYNLYNSILSSLIW